MSSLDHAAARPSRSSARRSHGAAPFAKALSCLLAVALATGLCPAVALAEPEPGPGSTAPGAPDDINVPSSPDADQPEPANNPGAVPPANDAEEAPASPAAPPAPEPGPDADVRTASEPEANGYYQYVKTSLSEEDLTQNLTALCNREIEGPQSETLLALPSAITIDMFAWSEYSNEGQPASFSLAGDGADAPQLLMIDDFMVPAPIVDIIVKPTKKTRIKKGLSTAGGIVGMISDFMAHHRIKQIVKDMDALSGQIDLLYRNTNIISEQIAELKKLIEEESYKNDLQKFQEVYSRWEPRFKQVASYLEKMYGAVYEQEGAEDGVFVDQKQLEDSAETLMEYLRTLDITDMQNDLSQLSTLLSHATTQTGTSLVSSFNTVLDSRHIFQHQSIPSIDTFVTASSNVYYALARLYTERVGSDAYVTDPTAFGIELDSLDEYYSRMISDFDAVVADTRLMDFMRTVGFEEAQWDYVDTSLDASGSPTEAVKGDHFDVSELVFTSKEGDDRYNVMPDMLKQPFPITTYHDRYTGEELPNAALEGMGCYRVTSRATDTTYFIAERPLYRNINPSDEDYAPAPYDSDLWRYRISSSSGRPSHGDMYLKYDTSTQTHALVADADKLTADCANVNPGATSYSFASLISDALKDGHGQTSVIQNVADIDYIPTAQERVRAEGSISYFDPYVIPAQAYTPGSGLSLLDSFVEATYQDRYHWLIAIDFPKTTTDIYTAADFAKAAETFNTPYENQTYVLKSSITLDTNAEYLSRTLSNATFDGGGNTITYTKNDSQCNGDKQVVRYDQSSRQEGKPDGLFGSTDNATVKNLTVVGQLYQDQNNNFGTGGVVGYALNSTIDNVTSRVKVYNGGMFTGGVVGYAYYSSITNCTYEDMRTGFGNNHSWDGSVHGGSYFVGGIAGGFYGPSTEVEGHDFAKNRVVVLDESMRTDFAHTVYSDKWALGGVLGFIEGEAYTQERMVVDNCAYAGTPLASNSEENGSIVGKVTDAHAVFKNTRSTMTGNNGVLGKRFDGGKHLNGTASIEGFAELETLYTYFEYVVGFAFREATVEYRYPDGTVEYDYRGRVWYGDVIPVRDAPEGMCVADARWISDLEGGYEENALPWLWPEHDVLLTADSECAELMYPGAVTNELSSLYYNYDRLPLSGTLVVTYEPLVQGAFTAQVGGVQLEDGALRTVGVTLSRIIHAIKAGALDRDDVQAFLSDETLAALREAVESGAGITFDVAVSRQTDQALIDEAEAFLAKQGLADAQVLSHYDITITVLVNGKPVGTLDKLDRPVSFMMKPGGALEESRGYCAIAVHGRLGSNPQIELLDAQRLDGETLRISPERYSSFTLVSYDPAGGAADIAAQTQGKALASTGDGAAGMARMIALLALGALAACALSVRARKRRE
ncbi:hypothetical protein [Arabiibacter massiliensis]|uniref:hypothetical protein n=1 Tax=Arabiibacter massiliensis TaxID=1870985 RepID=UPI00117B8967|nr:hypothetical protein [Arabiibacter massiliensis]